MTALPKTVLVVEDETLIRRFIASILRDEGFRALQAADAAQATQIWNQESAAIGLVILDWMLPDANGLDLAQQFAGARSDLKLIFMSGMDEVAARIRQFPSSLFLTKPFDAAALEKALAQLHFSAPAPEPIQSLSGLSLALP